MVGWAAPSAQWRLWDPPGKWSRTSHRLPYGNRRTSKQVLHRWIDGREARLSECEWETGINRSREAGRERDGDMEGRRGLRFKKRRRPISTRCDCVLMSAEAGGGRFNDVSRYKHPPLSFRYRQCTHARFATPTGPPAYNGCAEGCTMANKHTGLLCFIRTSTCSYATLRRPAHVNWNIETNYPEKWQNGMHCASPADSLSSARLALSSPTILKRRDLRSFHPRMSSRI